MTSNVQALLNHSLKLKTSVPIVLLRNINRAKCLYNGTRLQVNHLGKKSFMQL